MSRLPDGYLRRLTTRRAVGQAMDRLYRELRLGIITPEMASVLLDILTRLMDSGLCDSGKSSSGGEGRCRADRLRPKIRELLTRAEQKAWRKAVANAPKTFLRGEAAAGRSSAVTEQGEAPPSTDNITLIAAS